MVRRCGFLCETIGGKRHTDAFFRDGWLSQSRPRATTNAARLYTIAANLIKVTTSSVPEFPVLALRIYGIEKGSACNTQRLDCPPRRPMSAVFVSSQNRVQPACALAWDGAYVHLAGPALSARYLPLITASALKRDGGATQTRSNTCCHRIAAHVIARPRLHFLSSAFRDRRWQQCHTGNVRAALICGNGEMAPTSKRRAGSVINLSH